MIQRERIEIEVTLNDRNILRALERINDRITGLINETQNMNQSFKESESVLSTTVRNFDLFGTAIGLLGMESGTLKKNFASLKKGLIKLGSTMVGPKVSGAIAAFKGKLVGSKGLVAALGILKGPIGLVMALLAGGLFLAFRNTGNQASTASDSINTFTERMNDLKTKYSNMNPEIENQKNLVDRLRESYEQASEEQGFYAEAIGHKRKALERAEGVLASLIDTQNEHYQAMVRMNTVILGSV